MNYADLIALSPLIVLAATSIVVMLVIAFYRSHLLTLVLTLLGLALAAASISFAASVLPRAIPPLIMVDRFALYYTVLVLLASFSVAALSYPYLKLQVGHAEEFYLLLLAATVGCSVLAAATHFASFFLGIEILSVSLYALAAYLRHRDRSIEAGVKYLILAAISSAFILFGMALVYVATGTMEFRALASLSRSNGVAGPVFLAGTCMIVAGIGFKLALVPFHLWTPDVYEGAPAPVTAFVATASKGAVFALVLRYVTLVDLQAHPSLFAIFTAVAIASMFVGNLLALFQKNIKRMLAYSSISHLGYLLVTLLASSTMAVPASSFYLTAYFITTLGAFGVVTVLSTTERDADSLDDYQGLAWRRPWLAAVLSIMLFSLAGIPLTAGFMGKFYVVAAGVGSSLWLLVASLVINSAIGLYYYLRIIVAMFSPADREIRTDPTSVVSSVILTALTLMLLWLGMYPGPVISLIGAMTIH